MYEALSQMQTPHQLIILSQRRGKYMVWSYGGKWKYLNCAFFGMIMQNFLQQQLE
jgi:hypothetical protein